MFSRFQSPLSNGRKTHTPQKDKLVRAVRFEFKARGVPFLLRRESTNDFSLLSLFWN